MHEPKAMFIWDREKNISPTQKHSANTCFSQHLLCSMSIPTYILQSLHWPCCGQVAWCWCKPVREGMSCSILWIPIDCQKDPFNCKMFCCPIERDPESCFWWRVHPARGKKFLMMQFPSPRIYVQTKHENGMFFLYSYSQLWPILTLDSKTSTKSFNFDWNHLQTTPHYLVLWCLNNEFIRCHPWRQQCIINNR